MTISADQAMNVIGVVGASAISLSLVPQVILTCKSKRTADISHSSQLIYTVGATLGKFLVPLDTMHFAHKDHVLTRLISSYLPLVNAYAIYFGYWAFYVPCLFHLTMIYTVAVLQVICGRRNGSKSRFNLGASSHSINSITLRATQTFDSKDQSETSHGCENGPENDEKLPLSFINISYGGIDFACLPKDQDISFGSAAAQTL